VLLSDQKTDTYYSVGIQPGRQAGSMQSTQSNVILEEHKETIPELIAIPINNLILTQIIGAGPRKT